MPDLGPRCLTWPPRRSQISSSACMVLLGQVALIDFRYLYIMAALLDPADLKLPYFGNRSIF